MRNRRMSLLAASVALLAAMTGCVAGSGTERTYAITAGDPSGVYYGYSHQLAQALESSLHADVTVLQSDGSVENLLRVGSGEAILGFAQGDTAADALFGEGKFPDPLPIAAVARVYDEYVHVVVPEDSPVQSIADLAGRRVSLGARNSGVHVISERVLLASGVPIDAVRNVEFGLEESIAALKSGSIDAFFWVGGLPTPGIEHLQRDFPLRLLPIDVETVEAVNAGHAGVYQFADFPVEIYDLRTPAVTMVVPNYLVTHEEADRRFIEDTLRVLFEHRAAISRDVAAANSLDRRKAIFTAPIELHPGAVSYFVNHRY